MGGEVTISVVALITLIGHVLNLGGTWALIKFKVDAATKRVDDAHGRLDVVHPLARDAAAASAEALRVAKAAHDRVDNLSEKHDAVKSTTTMLDERTRNQGARLEGIATQIMGQLTELNKKLDEAIRDGLIAGRKQ
jgi:hypothetical protein